MPYFRITNALGADIGPVNADSRGHYIGDPRQTFALGDLLNFHSNLSGRSSVESVMIVQLVRVQDHQGLVRGVERDLGEICEECTVRSIVGQASGPDFDAAIREVDSEALHDLNHADEIEVNILVVNNRTIVDPRIRFLEYDGDNFEILEIPHGSRLYERGNAITIRVRKL